MRNTGATGQPVSHQTVKLARGKHASPDDGVCVMELASMLAGEEFSDHPLSVCPVIGAFLRAYNDRVDDRWRRDLWAYAAKAVGTRSTIAVERERALICRERTRQMNGQGALGEPAGPSDQPGRLSRWLQSRRRDSAGRQAALVFGRVGMGYGGVLKVDCVHRAALRFVDELIAVGGRDEQRLQGLGPDLCPQGARARNRLHARDRFHARARFQTDTEAQVPNSLHPIASNELRARRKRRSSR